MLVRVLAVTASLVLSGLPLSAWAQGASQLPPASAPQAAAPAMGQRPSSPPPVQHRGGFDRQPQMLQGGTTVGNGLSTRMSDTPGTRMSATPDGRPVPNGLNTPSFNTPGFNTPDRFDDNRPKTDWDRRNDWNRHNDNSRTVYQGQRVYGTDGIVIVTPGVTTAPTVDEIGAICDRRWDELERNRKTFNLARWSFIDQCLAGRI